MSLENDKTSALDAAMKQIERQFGKGSIMKLGVNVVIGIRSRLYINN